MAEPMSDERLAEIHADHERFLRDVERFGTGGMVHGARTRMEMIGDLLAEVDRLREQLAAAQQRAETTEAERDAWKSEAERRGTERNAAARRVGALRAWLYELGHAPDAVDERLRRVLAAREERAGQ